MLQQTKIFEFILNRQQNGESTALRHIHRRFDLDYSDVEIIISDLLKTSLIYKFYDDDYEEYRFSPNLDMTKEPS